MLMVNRLKYITILLVMTALAGFADAQTKKQNPFEVMRAIAEKKKLPPEPKPEPVSKPEPEPIFVPIQTAPLVEMEEEEPDLYVEAIMLKFLKAKNVLPAIENLIKPHGSISTDDDTNTLIVSGTRKQLDRVLEQIRKADQTPKQIMIEVVIIDVQIDDDTEIGVDWSQTSLGRGSGKETYAHSLIPSTVTTGMTFGFIRDGINLTVKALQEKKNVEILASPRLLVLSGQTAHIKTAEEIPYEESSDTSMGGSLTSTKFKDVGITLDVTAIITDEGKIILNVNPSQSVKTGESVNDVPVVDSRSMETTLIMEDGQAVVIGGLRRKEETFTSHGVPWFSDIPFIGALFRSDKTETVSSELLIMISPHIYGNRSTITDYELKRFNELKKRPPLQFQSRKPRVLENIQTAENAIKKIATK